jgi:hypothetical protein
MEFDKFLKVTLNGLHPEYLLSLVLKLATGLGNKVAGRINESKQLPDCVYV